MARPPKKPQDRRGELLQIPLTTAEKRRIASACRRMKVPMAQWTRNVILTALDQQK